MIDKALLAKTVDEAIAGSDIFVVEIAVSEQNSIVVEIDSASAGIDIDTCARITRAIEAVFDRDVEDYELEVGSAGLTSPFKVRAQYVKNIGNEVEVLTCDGRKLHGTLTAVGDDDDTFTIEVPTKVKAPGAKRPTIEMVPETFAVGECRSVRYNISFK